jgi:predicted nucleotide-binding protein (sugar kinase/HSP70/actin superfamily)
MNIKDLKEKIKGLKKEISRLQDENNSLWFMLDEFDKSNIHNPEYNKIFEEAFKKLREQSKMIHSKVEEA